MKKIVINQFVVKLMERLGVIVERKRKDGKDITLDHFHDFPDPPEHYLFVVDRVTFSLMVLCTDSLVQVELFLGENPQDYFLPASTERVPKRKKTFSKNSCLQNNPFLLTFVKNKQENECWTTIQVPNHNASKKTIIKICFLIQDMVSLLSPKKEPVPFVETV